MKPIETKRLLITTWSIEDISDACALWGDPKVMEFIDTRGGLSRAQVEEKLHQEVERQEKFGVQYWKVVLKESGKTIGCCGLRPHDLKNRVYEIGFHIMSAHWGIGYAKEAANAVITHAFEEMHIPKLFAGHNPKNSTSKSMLQKLGFKFVSERFYPPTGLNHPSYELDASSWSEPLIGEYEKQFEWRDWSAALSKCPIVPNQQILDLGCAMGDLSRELAKRGAIVTGVDANPDLIKAANAKRYSNCTFVEQDLSSLKLDKKFDGLWCSFTAAYFTNFRKALSQWTELLKKNAWVCIIEIDDLLGHEPISPESRQKIDSFYDEALQSQRYDFRMGRKLEAIMAKQGFTVSAFNLRDQELSFDGLASEAVVQAWRSRFSRMGGLEKFWGPGLDQFKQEFLRSLTSEKHHSTCRVVCCIGVRRDPTTD